ncbi:MAG TPA: hypothetical protein VMS94_06655 [Acidobacteriota bacterium]|nr:hypothetical protein [Acidobacteriota bacterium]
MSIDPARMLITDFLKSSWQCVEALVKELAGFKERENGSKKKSISLFYIKDGRRNDVAVDGSHFFLRSSVEYSNPQLTIEEVQGIIAARLIEACGSHFYSSGLHEPDERDFNELFERLKKPAEGLIVPFLLNTDDIEPDRYSMNPLKESIVNSGQSAFPAAVVTTDSLEIDQKFVQKYDGSLISRKDVEVVASCLKACGNSYMNMVDAVKYEQMEQLSTSFGIDLRLPTLRMPLEIIKKEAADGLLHHIIREVHKDYASVERVYTYIDRSMKNRTTLLTIPHSQKGYGSKRAVKGKLYFDGTKLKNVKVDYATTPLYPNAIDPSDVSIAKADDHFTVESDKLINYSFNETPSSPQFFLYSLASPENAALWHGVGAFGASQLVKSYATMRYACVRGLLIKNLKETYGLASEVPLQFNLVPTSMWGHPVHHNIDASINCVENLSDLVKKGMKLETLSVSDLIRQ